MIQEYLNIIKSIENLDRMKKRNGKEKGRYNLHIILFASIMVFMVLAFVFLFIYKQSKIEWWRYLSLISLISTYVALLLMPFIEIYQDRKEIKMIIALPFNFAINANVKNESESDNEQLPELIKLNTKTLELGLMEITHEKSFFEKRILIFVGPIEKLGLLPGILATLAMAFKIENQSEWVTIIAYGYIGLMLVSVSMQPLLARYERMIALTKLAISLKKENE